MKRFLSILTLLLLLVVQGSVYAATHDSYAEDETGKFYLHMVYDDVTDESTVTLQYIYSVEKDMVFPAKLFARFEDFNGKGNALEGDFYYTLGSSAYIDMVADKDVIETITILCSGEIPDNFANYTENESHTDPTALRSVTIGTGITKIGSYAFAYHENLESITFANIYESKLTEIGDNAFASAREEDMMPGVYTCYGGLTSLELPVSLTKIGANAFEGQNQLTELSVPYTVSVIGGNAFGGCGITDLTLGSGAGGGGTLTTSPFVGCPLKEVTIKAINGTEGAEAVIAPYMFANVSSAFSIVFDIAFDAEFIGFYEKCLANSGVTSIKLWLNDNFEYTLSPVYPYAVYFGESSCEFTSNLDYINIMAYDIKNNIVVDDKAFYYSGLKKFDIKTRHGFNGPYGYDYTYSSADKLLKIGASAFEGSKLTGDLVIPKYTNPFTKEEDFLELGENAFANTQYLTSVTFEGKTNEGLYEWLPQGIFYRSGIKSVTLPTNITAIGVEAFAESKLETFTANANIEDIYQGAFKGCKELTSVDLSESKVEYLREEIFRYDSKLAELKLPEEMQNFQQYAFEGTALKSLNVNASHIDAYAIYDMPELEEVSFVHPAYKFIGEQTLVSLPKLKTIDFGNIEYLNKNFISDCPLYDSIVIGPAVTQIDKEAFSQVADNVKSITLKSGVVKDIADIADAPFSACTAAVYVDPSVTYVPKHLFAYTHVTNSVDVRSDLAFDDDAFKNAIIDSLDWHYPEESVYPFKSAEVQKLTFSKMTDIKQNGLFQGAYIRNLYLEGITDISGEYVFEDAVILNKDRDYTLVIPASMKKIGKSAFRNVSIGANLLFEKGTGLTIAEKAFENTYAYYHVTSLYDKDNIPVAADDAFDFGDKVNTFFAGSCSDVEAYKAAKGWKDMPVTKWDGITEYKYSFEVVGETTKRPIEYYYDMLYVNGENPNMTYIGCDNKAKIEFYSPCAEVVFDHWEDGSKDATSYNITLTSDTVIRIYVKETQHDVKLALARPELSDVAKIYMASTTDPENWVEQSSAKVNSCEPLIYNAKVVLSDPAHYSFMRWYNTSDNTTYSTDPEIYYISDALDLKAEIYVNEYSVMVELDPSCWDCMSQTDHMELNGVNMGTSISDNFEYNTEITLEFFGVSSGDNKYILDYWQDEFGAIVSEENPYTFKVTDYCHYYPVIKAAGKYAVTVKSSDDALGSADMDFAVGAETSKGSGIFWEKSEIELSAASKGMHYYFKQWNDGSEENPHTITVKKAFEYVAEFEKDSFNIDIQIEGIPEELVEVTGAGRYGWDDEATLSYTLLDDHYEFQRWLGETYSVNDIFKFNVQQSMTVRVVFSPKNYTVTVVANPAEGGTITGGGDVPYNSLLILKAEANEGYEFAGWEDDNEAPAERPVMIFGDVTYQANFKLIEHTVTVKSADETMGTVKGGGTYAHNSTAKLEAEPKEHYKFVRWDDDNTDNPRTITVTADASFTAYFAIITHDITVKADDDKKGTVKGSGTYNEGETISIEATPAEHYKFVQWSDGVKDNPRSVVVTTDATFTAEFEIIQHTITVAPKEEKQGTVKGGGKYDEGATAVIEATAAEHYQFVQWNDGNTDNPRSVVVSADATFVAEFKVIQHTITVKANNDEMGKVSGTGTFDEGSVTTITAAANDGYQFVKWNDGVTNNPRTVTVDADATFTAVFEAIPVPTYTITVLSADMKAGSVSGSGTYEEGEKVEIKATANKGYKFSKWNDGNTDDTRTITVTADATFIASFEEESAPEPTKYTITVKSNDETMGYVTGKGTYAEGSKINIEAIPNKGYEFVEWDDHNTANPREITVTADASYTAIFKATEPIVTTYTITVESADDEMGKAVGGGVFESGKEIEIAAIAYKGYTFVKWSDGNTQNPRTITVIADATYKAEFAVDATPEPTYYTITVVSADATMGKVSGSNTYAENTIIDISAIPNTGYHFIQWSDGNTQNPRTIVVTADAEYTAQFAKDAITDPTKFVINVMSSDNEMGSTSGTGAYELGETVKITAEAKIGYKFVKWNDGNTENPRSIVVISGATYVATFAEIGSKDPSKYTVDVTSANVSLGNVYGGGTFTENSVIQIIAVPTEGYDFDQWSDGNTDNPRTITVTEDITLTATFKKLPINTYFVNVISSDLSMGTVSGGGKAELGGHVLLYAYPNDGYRFVSWNNGNTNNPYYVEVTGAATYIAIFAPIGTGIDNAQGSEPVVRKVMIDGRIYIVRGEEMYTIDGRKLK